MSFPAALARDGRLAAVRILLIGGEPTAASAVQTLLEGEGHEVRHRFLAAEAIEVLTEWGPSVVLVCLQVADMDGIDLCRAIHEKYSCPILAVCATADEDAVVRALDDGADDVLTKPLRVEELKARLRALLRRTQSGEIIAPQIVCGALHIDGARRKVTLAGEPVALTRTEFDILLFLAIRRDTVQPQETILRAVWGFHHGQYVQTLRVHIGHIRQKIEDYPAEPKYILTEAGIGYRFSDPHSSSADTAKSVIA